jgi:hypothetical protein
MYFYFYRWDKIGKYLSDHFGGCSKINFNLSQIIEIEIWTGHTPAVLGCDHVPGWAYVTTPEKLVDYSCNQFLKDHSNKHG